MTFQLPKNFAVGTAFQALNTGAQEDNLADGIGQSYGVIGYKGKAWTLRYRGQVKQFVRPDDGTPASYIDVIILGSPPKKSKSYYPKYVPGASDGERPICSSFLGDVPDAGVTKQQATSCALCPRNEWKTDPATGRKSRECTDYKRLAVLIMPKISEALLGSPLLEPVFLRVPPDSLQAAAQMGDNMAKQGLHYSSYVTRVSFDPQKSHPSMVFTPVQGLSNEEAPVILDLRKNPLVDRIMYGDATQVGIGAVAGANQLAPAGYQPTGLLAAVANRQALPSPSIVPEVDTSYVDLVQGNSQVTQLVQAGDVRSLASMHPSAGVTQADIAQATARRDTVAAKPVTVADVGSADLSDDDLDAKIAAMIKSNR